MNAREASPDRAIPSYLARIRRRVLAQHILASLPWTVAATAGAVLAAGALTGPAPSSWQVVLGWLLPLVPCGLACVRLRRTLAPLSGPSVAAVLARSDAWLASALRSAVELDQARSSSPAPSLVAAHHRAVCEALARVDLVAALPLLATVRRTLALTSAMLALAVPAAASSADVRMGLYALTHPFAREGGLRLASVVASLHVRATPPSHRADPPFDSADPTRLTVPEGSRLRVRLETRVDALEAELALGGSTARMTRVDAHRFQVETSVRSGGPILVRVRTAEGWLRDATPRTLEVVEDAAPEIRIVASEPGAVVERDAELVLSYRATDDVGLGELVRVVRPPSGAEQRSVLASPAPRTRALEGQARLLLADLDLRPGDSVTVVLEVTDNDTVDGPKTTRTDPLTFTVDDGRSERQRATEDLRGLLDAALDTLATRLEADLPDDAAAMLPRAERLATSVEALIERLRAVAASEVATEGLSPPDRGFLRAVERRLTPLANEDRRAPSRGRTAVERADEHAVDVLEVAVLGLADLLGRVELEDAASLAREIAALQRELASLVRELRENPSQALRDSVRATMERIRQRMGELESRLASMNQELPAEFRNAAQAATERARDTLGSIDRALASDDLDALDRAVAELEQALRDMTQRSEGASDEFTQSRFGPRQRAFADAFERLAELEVEQQALANDSSRVRDGLSERALDALGDDEVAGLAPLAAEARRVEQSLAQLGRMRGAPIDRNALTGAEARVADAREALAHGNVGDAREALVGAAQTVDALAFDLELSRRMFDGPGGRVSEAATAARRAADELRALDDRVTERIPALERHLRAADQSALEANGQRQERAESAAGSIADTLDGAALGEPIAPDVAAGLREAGVMMAEARNALFNRDPIGAASAQSRAARRIRELREDIERQSSSSSAGGGGGGGGGGEGSQGGNRVEVPGARASEDAASRRRRVLDAMGDDVPEGYRGSVRRYYEELLR